MTAERSQNEALIAEFDSDYYDTQAMRDDDSLGNFSPERADDYLHLNIVLASLANGQFTQAREQCARFGLEYAEMRAMADA